MAAFHHTRTWRKIRERQLAKEPCCQLCRMNGRDAVAATEVHHLLSVDDFPEEKMNPMYLQSVCAACHDQLGGNQWKKGYGRVIPLKVVSG
jgi:5-methylcytosine-specific restriction endonuclease McrA